MFFLAAFFDNVWNRLHGGVTFWTIFGLTGNIMFTSRFVVQWYVSERLKQSVIPKNFWHLSLVGGVIQLIYALHIGAVPLILGFVLPPIIAMRNLILINRHARAAVPGPMASKLPTSKFQAPKQSELKPADHRSGPGPESRERMAVHQDKEEE